MKCSIHELIDYLGLNLLLIEVVSVENEQVMCNRCSSNKTTLAYDTSKAFRVCDGCFDTLTSKAPSSTSQPSSESSTAAGTSSPVSSPVAENNPSSTNYRTGLLEVRTRFNVQLINQDSFRNPFRRVRGSFTT